MLGWWLAGTLALALLVALWRWRLAHRERLTLRGEMAHLRDDLRVTRDQRGKHLQSPLLSDATLDALVLADPERRVLALNLAARDLFSYAAQPDDLTLMALTRHHEIDALAASALSHGEDLDTQINVDGRPFRVRALVEETGSGRRVALALRDVSELHRLSRARREMVANVSHELRTPITSIRLLVETLVGGALRDEIEGPALLDKIAAETNTLRQMAQELLDLSMIESGQALVRLVPLPVDDLLSEAIEHLSEQARRKNQEVMREACPGVLALADPEMVGRVLTNLLHNAITFTQEGGHIRLACEADGEWARVSVTDDGPGIAHADRERVFERFYRASRARGGPGTGLGLAIAKHIVEAHGGRIWVGERDIGQPGAQVAFTLPLAEGAISATHQTRPTSS